MIDSWIWIHLASAVISLLIGAVVVCLSMIRELKNKCRVESDFVRGELEAVKEDIRVLLHRTGKIDYLERKADAFREDNMKLSQQREELRQRLEQLTEQGGTEND